MTEVGRTARGPFVVAGGWLWIDGIRVYSASNLAVGVTSDG